MYDHCVYFKIFNGNVVILVLCVDDMLFVSKSMEEINRLKVHHARMFNRKDLGAAKQILGMVQNRYWEWRKTGTGKIESSSYHSRSMRIKYL